MILGVVFVVLGAVDPFVAGQEQVRLAESGLWGEPEVESRLEARTSAEALVSWRGETPDDTRWPLDHALPALNLELGAALHRRVHWRFEFEADGAREVRLRQAWIDAAISGEALRVRVGPTLRRFGLHNDGLSRRAARAEVADPEPWDPDHPLLTRTTDLTVHGQVDGVGYAVTTGRDERDDVQIPLGIDLRWGNDAVTVGGAFYTTGGHARATEGGAVARWMRHDAYQVVGLYGALELGALNLDAAWFQASHEAERDPNAVLAFVDGLTRRRRVRYLRDPDRIELDQVRTEVDYQVQSIRLAARYRLETGAGAVVPHGRLDVHVDGERLPPKRGGDDESGLADDGRFFVPTAGVAWWPLAGLAIKAEGALYFIEHEGEDRAFPELRAAVAWDWER